MRQAACRVGFGTWAPAVRLKLKRWADEGRRRHSCGRGAAQQFSRRDAMRQNWLLLSFENGRTVLTGVGAHNAP